MEPVMGQAARFGAVSLLRLQSDERLARLAAARNEAAFEALARRYREPLLRSCQRILPNGEAEDAVQQALLRAHQALIRNGPPDAFRPWLHKIAVNAALDLVAAGGETVPLDENFDGVEQPDEVAERRERLGNVVGAISSLPASQREALVLREFEGRSHEEIGLELGLSGGAVRQLIYRARESVRGAATALTPPPLIARLLAGADGGARERLAEIAAGGAGGAVAAKAAVAVLVAGGVAGGAAVAPSGDRDGRGDGGIVESAKAAPPSDGPVAQNGLGPASGNASPDTGSSEGSSGGSDSGAGSQGSGGSSGHGGDSGSSGSGSHGSGDSDPDGHDADEVEVDSSGSGSSGSGSSGSGSSGSGISGSDSSGSGSSGSGSSGSGSSGSGSSGSGSDTSDSSGSGSSGSGSDTPDD